jgi:membrane-associated protein
MPPLPVFPQLPDVLTPLIESGRPWLERYGLLIVGAGLFTETLLFTGAIVPGFAILIAAGYLAATGVLPLWPALLLAWAGALAGDAASYGLGRVAGAQLLKRKEAFARRLKLALEREGPILLLWYHYAPALRAVLPCAAGSARYDLRRWFVFDSLGVALWVAVIFGMGYSAGRLLHERGNLVFHVINTAAFWLMLWALWRFQRNLRRYEAEADAPHDVPEETGGTRSVAEEVRVS